jgi:cation diffusion facilitator family transporter
MSRTGARVALLGLAINVVLASVKIVAGVVGHAYVLIADGIESALDVGGSIVIWGGLTVAARPPDRTHPYGHGKAEPIAALVVAICVLAAAIGLAIESVREILTPHHGPAPFTLAILVAVIVIKEFLFRYVNRIGRDLESTAVQTDAWHHRSDVITSLAAAVGISIALVGGKEYAGADEVAAIVAAGIIFWNGGRLLRPALNELMDRSPSGGVVERIRNLAQSVPGVEQVEKCLVRKMGYQYYVDMHVEVDPQMTVQRSHEIAHEVKDKIRGEMHTVRDVLVHIEPVRHRP